METIPLALTLTHKDCFDGEDSSKVAAAIADLMKTIAKSDIDIYVENDGIGMYECWGHVGFDKGKDYLCIDDADDFILTLRLDWLSALQCFLSGKKLTQDDFASYVQERIIDYTSPRVETKGSHEYDDGISMDLKLVLDKPSLKGGVFTCHLSWEDADA
jgi:hypothetical protein